MIVFFCTSTVVVSQVIVGSVDGNRLWGKELGLPLRFVEWSPDSRLILFVTLEAEVRLSRSLYCSWEAYSRSLSLACLLTSYIILYFMASACLTLYVISLMYVQDCNCVCMLLCLDLGVRFRRCETTRHVAGRTEDRHVR